MWFTVSYHLPPSIYAGARRCGLYVEALSRLHADESVMVYVSPSSYSAGETDGPLSRYAHVTLRLISGSTHPPQSVRATPSPNVTSSDKQTGKHFYSGLFVPTLSNLRWGRRVAADIVAQGIGPNDTVITMSKPYENHLVGYYLSKRYGCRWVVDFRELFADHRKVKSPRLNLIANMIEHEIFANADIVTAVTPGMARHYAVKHRRTVLPLYNGVSEDQVLARASRLGEGACVWSNRTPFKIVYTGSLEGDRSQSLANFLALVKRSKEALGQSIEFEYYGVNHAVAEQRLVEVLADSPIKYLASPQVESSVAEAKQQDADMLLLFPHTGNTLESQFGLTVKIYNYLETLRPIVYYGKTKGDLYDFVQQFPQICILDTDATESQNLSVFRIWIEQMKETPIASVVPLVLEYDWKHQLRVILS